MKRASIFLLAFVAVVSVASAREKKTHYMGPVYIDRVPLREKAIIEKPEFEKRPRRETSGIVRPTFDERSREHNNKREKPVFDTAEYQPSLWDKTVLETKWTDDNQADLERYPQEKRGRKSPNRHKVYKGVRAR